VGNRVAESLQLAGGLLQLGSTLCYALFQMAVELADFLFLLQSFGDVAQHHAVFGFTVGIDELGGGNFGGKPAAILATVIDVPAIMATYRCVRG
jgi:hypothetical protein